MGSLVTIQIPDTKLSGYKKFPVFNVRYLDPHCNFVKFQNEKEIWADTPAKAAIVLRHAALERDKRCLLVS